MIGASSAKTVARSIEAGAGRQAPPSPTPAGVVGARGARERATADPPWRVRGDYAAVVALFIASRAFLLGIGWFTLHVTSSPFSAQPLLPDLLVRWDSLWYIQLAQSGYSTVEPLNQAGATNFAFYPAYPALIWLLSRLTGLGAAAAGVLISNAAFLAALYVIYALGRRFTGSRTDALIASMLISFVPEGFVFSAVYTESLFVLVTAASMLTYARGNYFTASVLSAVGSSIRSNGVFIAAWYGLEIVRKRGWRGALRFWERPEEYLPAVAAPLGLIAFWWLSYLQTGDAFAQKSTAIFGWGWRPDWPWQGIATSLWSGNFEDRFWAGTGLIALALSFTLLRKGHWTLFLYCMLNFALYFSDSLANSLLRYSISILPIYFGLAGYVRGPMILALILFPLLGGALMAAWALGAVITI